MASGGIGRVVHASPGRIRLRVARPHRTPETFSEITRLLAALPGVSAVDTNSSTGSVLIRYDASTFDVAHLLKLGAELGWISADATSANGAVRPGGASWRAQVDLGRAAQGAAVLAAAAAGAVLAPSLGVSARVGSLSAAAALILLRKWARR